MSIPKLRVKWDPKIVPKRRVGWNPLNTVQTEGNLVVIVIDDPPLLKPQHGSLFAFDRTGYDFDTDADNLYPATPNIDALADDGVTFTEFRAMPVCSPFRASFLTGVYPFRHGLGSVPKDNYGPQEFGDAGFVFTTLPSVLEAQGVSTGIVGKIHLSIPENEDFVTAPETGSAVDTGRDGLGYGIVDPDGGRLGFGYHSVWLRNLNQNAGAGSPGAGGDYYWHQHYKQGVLQSVTGSSGSTAATDYATTIQIDEALEFINAQTGRFFLYLPLNAVHSPFDRPPEALVSTTEYITDPEGVWKNHMAMMEAVDAEIGRLRSSMDADVLAKTTFVIVGDNGVEQFAYGDAVTNLSKTMGTGWDAISVASDQMKGSVKCSGVRTGMIWSGPGIATAGRQCDAMVNVTDFMPTIREFFATGGTDPTPGEEGESFMPLLEDSSLGKYEHTRRGSFHEIYRPNGTAPESLPVANYEQVDIVERGYVGLVTDTLSNPGDDPTKLGQFLLTRKLTEEAAPAPLPTSRTPLGINASFNTDWKPQYMWTDAMKSARRWIPQDSTSPGTWDTGAALTLDANKYPLLSGTQWAATVMFKDINGRYPSGTYTVTYDGTGSLGFAFNFNQYDVDTITDLGSNTYELEVTAGTGGIFLRIESSDTEDPVRNIQVQMPGQSLGQRFHSDYLAIAQRWACIRFMDLGSTNDNMVTTAASRPLTTWATQNWSQWDDTQPIGPHRYRPFGIAVEHMIELCNAASCDMWYCFPAFCEDDYVTAVAALIEANLRSDLKVYLEFTNEHWNDAGDPFYQGLTLEWYALNVKGYTSEGSDFNARMRWFAERSVEIHNLCDAQFGATRLANRVRVLGGRIGSHTDAGPASNATALLTTYGGSATADAYGIAPYVGRSIGNTDHSSSTTADIKALLDTELTNTYDDTAVGSVQAIKAVSDAAGAQLVCYEAGTHIVDTLSIDASRQVFVDFARSTDGADFVSDYVQAWRDLQTAATDPTGIMCWFEMIEKYHEEDGTVWKQTYGLLEYQTQTDSKKWDAIMDDTAAGTDQLFHIEDLNGDAVDPFELTPLDIEGDYSEQYEQLRVELDALLASSPPTSGNYRLPIVDAAGNASYVTLNATNDLEITGTDGSTEQIVSASGQTIPILDELGNSSYITLEDNPS